ncbi:HlyD family secretion protein [Thalassotalea profundi]|uniref:Lipoyl-binding domain-containing protein n=1 Tax=Thalassotalea profundi TaxID=2036687 RepID=A0ABQ3IB81_9GAMM|nr:HlyD family efflux transporter periplasmic adaptor subunit [Thalassotalea profundi]GHE76768.1 hypothetical protein GCM10011501_00100 [Thalassotalea profundi]
MQQYIQEKTEFSFLVKASIITALSFIISILVYVIVIKNDEIPTQYSQLMLVESHYKPLKIKGIGAIVPSSKTIIPAPSKGNIVSLTIRPGQLVTKGQVLTKINNYELEQQLQESKYALVNLRSEVALKKSDLQIKQNQLEADLNQRKNFKKKQKLELDAYNKLIKKGIVSKIKFEQSKMAYEQMTLDVESSERQLTWFNKNLLQQQNALNTKITAAMEQLAFIQERKNSLTVRADSSGIIKEVNIHVGQMVAQGQNLFEIIDNTKLQAEIQIPQYSSANIALYQQAEILTPNGKFEAQVEHIDSVIRQGAVSVYLSFINTPPNWVRVDQSIEAIIQTEKVDERFFIRKPLQFEQHAEWALYVVENDSSITKLSVGYSVDEDNLYIQSDNFKGKKLLLVPDSFSIGTHYDKEELSNL